jgi:hypothetical protein
MTMRDAATTLLVVVLATACAAPGEPPARPGSADYQDVIRRELSTTTSALATMQLTLAYANDDRLPQTYATTITHQAEADLSRVSTDLAQIHPPPQYATAHRELQTLTTRAARQLASLPSHWTQTTRTRELRRLNDQSTTTTDLSQQLLG